MKTGKDIMLKKKMKENYQRRESRIMWIYARILDENINGKKKIMYKMIMNKRTATENAKTME